MKSLQLSLDHLPLSINRIYLAFSGGIDSSLYACYLDSVADDHFDGINCIFGDDDPEFAYARSLANKLKINFHVGKMEGDAAAHMVSDTVDLTAHPFSDFSSLPIVYILKYMKENVTDSNMLIEGNGGDDCFGFPDLGTQTKMMIKSRFPGVIKTALSALFSNSDAWRIESQKTFLARILALSDVHEINPLNYFLALTPVNFIGLREYQSWDREVNRHLETGFTNLVENMRALSYEANTTVRQLMHVNSRRWAAKAHSVAESLGIKIVYPYIWRDILVEQGKIPWQIKINQGVVKWPLKRLLEQYMPHDFIYRKKSGFVPPFKSWLTDHKFNQMVRDILLSPDSNITRIVPAQTIELLLNDANKGENLRHAILNFLWGSLFTEMWIKKYQSI